MRRDLLAVAGALVLLVGFVLLLGEMTDRVYGRTGPFDMRDPAEPGAPSHAPEGEPLVLGILTFRGEDIITVRTYDAGYPPDMRVAPIPDSLNRVVASMNDGQPAPAIVVRDVPGVDFELVRVDPDTGEELFLLRATPDDAADARARGDSTATAATVAAAWKEALERAFRAVADSLASTAGGSE